MSTAGSGHIDLVAHLLAYQNGQSGAFSPTPGGSGTYAAISTTDLGGDRSQGGGAPFSAARGAAVSWLASQQASDGGFSFTPGGSVDPDDTAAAVEALRTGGISAWNTTIERALSYLHSQQMSNGGFTSGMGGTTNAESTAWAVQAIRAVGQNPAGASLEKGGKTPIGFLLGLQAGSGAFYHYGTTLAMPLLPCRRSWSRSAARRTRSEVQARRERGRGHSPAPPLHRPTLSEPVGCTESCPQ